MKNYGLAVPTYNRCDELHKLLQTIPATVPVAVSDNGSTLPELFQQKYKNIAITKIFPHVSMFENWNLAANSVQTEWLAIPSDDDLYYEKSFPIIEKYLAEYSNMDMIVFGHHAIDADGAVLSGWQPELESCAAPSGFLKFKYGVDARMPSVFIKTALFKKLGGFDEGFKITAADSDLIQRAALIGHVQFVPETVSGYRVWEGGLTHKKIASIEWMDEIDRWCDRIARFCDERHIGLYSHHVRDEIYARNLLAGVVTAKKDRGYVAAWAHLMTCRYPFRARPRTQLGLLYRLIKP